MDCPIRFWAALALGVAAPATAAEESLTEAGPKRARAVSSRVAEALNEVAARQASAPTSAAAPTESAARLRVRSQDPDTPANGIVRLPSYVVREPRMPPREEVMSRRELEKFAMQKYLGDENGFDRGFLNLFNLAALWKKIPLLGTIPLAGFVTNEDRAMQMYQDERDRERWADAMSLLPPSQRERVMHPDRPAPLK